MRYAAVLLVFFLVCGVAPAIAGTPLSDEEMDQMVAQGWKPDKSPAWNIRNRTNTNQQVIQICAYSICNGPIAAVSQVSQDPSSIVIQTPWSVRFGPAVVTVPTVQVPSVTFNQTDSRFLSPNLNISNSFIKIP